MSVPSPAPPFYTLVYQSLPLDRNVIPEDVVIALSRAFSNTDLRKRLVDLIQNKSSKEAIVASICDFLGATDDTAV